MMRICFYAYALFAASALVWTIRTGDPTLCAFGSAIGMTATVCLLLYERRHNNGKEKF